MRTVMPCLVLALMGLSGCEPSYTYQGYTMHSQFPLDGSRYWLYSSDDGSVTNEMRVDKVEPPRTADDGAEIYTFEHSDDETDDLIYSVDWSSDASRGILIHGYQVFGETSGGGGEDGGDTDTGEAPPPMPESVTFDPPVVFASANMAPGEVVETETGGWNFSAELEYSEPCPNHWSQGWNECLRMKLDDGDGDDTTGAKVAVTYWLVKRYGVAWFQNTADSEKWVLREAYWAVDE